MIRLLGLVLLAFLIWLCLEAAVRALRDPGEKSGEKPGPRPLPPEQLVRCAGCGAYFPRSRAVTATTAATAATAAGEEGPFCSPECQSRGAAAASSI